MDNERRDSVSAIHRAWEEQVLGSAEAVTLLTTLEHAYTQRLNAIRDRIAHIEDHGAEFKAQRIRDEALDIACKNDGEYPLDPDVFDTRHAERQCLICCDTCYPHRKLCATCLKTWNVCSKCTRIYTIDSRMFNHSYRSPNGLMSDCRLCQGIVKSSAEIHGRLVQLVKLRMSGVSYEECGAILDMKAPVQNYHRFLKQHPEYDTRPRRRMTASPVPLPTGLLDVATVAKRLNSNPYSVIEMANREFEPLVTACLLVDRNRYVLVVPEDTLASFVRLEYRAWRRTVRNLTH